MTDTDPEPDSTDIETDTDTESGTDSTSGDTPVETLLVSSLEESTGKTAITLALARLARDEGDSVGYMKPKGTRLQSNVGKTLDEDPLLARELLEFEAEMHDLEPVVYSPTFIEQAIRGREDPDELRDRVREAFETLAADRDRLFVEGGGRYDVGGIVDLADPDIADLLDARVLLVAPYEIPADVDDVIAAADRFGDRLAGVVFNDVSDAAYDGLETDVVPFLEGRGIPVHGVLPSERELSGVTIAELADELGASVLVDNGQDGYVERFTVGAMGSDSALRHFRRTRCRRRHHRRRPRRDPHRRTRGSRRPLSHPYRRPPALECDRRAGQREGRPDPRGADGHPHDGRTRRGRRPQRPDSRCRHRRPDATAAVRSRRRRLDSGIGSSVGGFGITLVSTDSCRFGSATPVSADLATDSTGRNCRCTGRNCRCTGRNCRCTGRPGRVRCDDYRV